MKPSPASIIQHLAALRFFYIKIFHEKPVFIGDIIHS